MSRLIFIFFGPPGSGKGTQSELLAHKLGWPIISTGDLLRHELHRRTKVGLQVADLMAKGELVPDKVVDALVAKRLAKPDTKLGVIFDGFPRDAKQLKVLLKMLSKSDIVWPIEIKVSDREVMNRLAGRRVCDCGETYHIVYNPPKKTGICNACGQKLYIREDDRPKIIRERLAHYKASAKPLFKYAKEQKHLLSFDGGQSIKKIQSELWQSVAKIIKKR